MGRQPAAMVQLGLLMYVAASGLGLDLGGLTVAAVGLGTASGATVTERRRLSALGCTVLPALFTSATWVILFCLA